jgi:hypothetical protein
MTQIASASLGRVSGMPPIPTLETIRPVLPSLTVFILRYSLQ